MQPFEIIHTFGDGFEMIGDLNDGTVGGCDVSVVGTDAEAARDDAVPVAFEIRSRNADIRRHMVSFVFP